MIKFYIGTYTKKESKGIYSALFNEENGSIQDLRLEVNANNPTYLINNDNNYLYGVTKKDDLAGVAIYKIKDNELLLINEVLDKGIPGCHISINDNKDLLVFANYHDEYIALYSLNNEFIELKDKVYFNNNEVKSHPHYINFTPNQDGVYMMDLGMDVVRLYDIKDNKLVLKQTINFPNGSGPRHSIFNPEKTILYVLSELSNELFVLDYIDNKFSIKQQISALPNNFTGNNGAAAIRISDDGKFVYTSNRSLDNTGVDSITTFKVKENGLVDVIDFTDCGGKHPRDFVLDPTNKYLIVANLITENIVVFKRNEKTGILEEKTMDINVNEPVCITFIK